MLITKGDLFHQEAKVRQSGLADLFRRIEIVSEKDPATYARLLEEFGVPARNFLMVGNSLRSDVLPVLALGGHAVYICAKAFMPHIPESNYPGQALSVYGFLEGGVRSCEIGPILRGRDAKTGKDKPGLDLVRLAIPRRVYTMNHMRHVADTFVSLKQRSAGLNGMKFVKEAPRLRHFSSTFDWA